MRLDRCGAFGSRADCSLKLPPGSSRHSAAAERLVCVLAAIALFALAAVSGFAAAQTPAPSPWDAPEPWRTDRFYLETSVYTRHFNYDPDHVNQQKLLLGEWNVTEQWLVGAALFDNSFGQSSQYVYGGYRFRPFEKLQPLYIKISAGLVHGYSGEYQDKIPFNSSGVAPVIIPSVGYCISRYCSEVVIFGTAGLLVTFGVTIP